MDGRVKVVVILDAPMIQRKFNPNQGTLKATLVVAGLDQGPANGVSTQRGHDAGVGDPTQNLASRKRVDRPMIDAEYGRVEVIVNGGKVLLVND